MPGRTVDWWALGVLLYELITGQSPFHGGSQMDVLTRIVCGRVPNDSLLSQNAWSIITDLLEVDPIRRLGSRVRGRRGVREHAFFAAHVNVDALEKRQGERREMANKPAGDDFEGGSADEGGPVEEETKEGEAAPADEDKDKKKKKKRDKSAKKKKKKRDKSAKKKKKKKDKDRDSSSPEDTASE